MKLLYFMVKGDWSKADYVGERSGPISYTDGITWACSILRYAGMPEGPLELWEVSEDFSSGRPVGAEPRPDLVVLEARAADLLRGAYPWQESS